MNNRKQYNDAFFLASFYRWSASLAYPAFGNNDPLTGSKITKAGFWDNHHKAAKQSYIAMAKYYLNICKELRGQ